MEAADFSDLSDAHRFNPVPRETLAQIRRLVVADLLWQRDAGQAIIWLIATGDRAAMRTIYDDLTAAADGAASSLLTVEAAVGNFGSDVVFGRAVGDRQTLGRAFDLATSLRDALWGDVPSTKNAEFETLVVERRARAEQADQRSRALSRLGVKPGAGLPFHELYMRRRSKRSWSPSVHDRH